MPEIEFGEAFGVNAYRRLNLVIGVIYRKLCGAVGFLLKVEFLVVTVLSDHLDSSGNILAVNILYCIVILFLCKDILLIAVILEMEMDQTALCDLGGNKAGTAVIGVIESICSGPVCLSGSIRRQLHVAVSNQLIILLFGHGLYQILGLAFFDHIAFGGSGIGILVNKDVISAEIEFRCDAFGVHTGEVKIRSCHCFVIVAPEIVAVFRLPPCARTLQRGLDSHGFNLDVEFLVAVVAVLLGNDSRAGASFHYKYH